MPKKEKIVKFGNKQFDFILLITVLVMLSLGIVMVLSASAPTSLSESGNSYKYVTKQAICAVIGLILMWVISKIDYRIYAKFYKLAYFGSIVLLLAVLVTGTSAGGAKRWLELGFLSFQPSEIAKIGLIVFYAVWLTKNKDKLKSLKDGFIVPFLWLVPVIAILLIVQSHLSATIIIILIVAIMMLMAGSRVRHFVTLGSIGGILAAVGLYVMTLLGKGTYWISRITSFLDPWADEYRLGEGWQVIQGLYAIGSGGLFGVGLGNSTQKYLYLPEPHNDFIFAVIAEELGFLGCLFVIVLFAIFIWRGILIAMKAPDMFGSLLAVGITALIGLQAIMNIAVVTSSMPNTGITLPFFSYGGTALIILLCAVGVLLNISRAGKKV